MQTPVENPLMTMESFNRQFYRGEKKLLSHAPRSMRYAILYSKAAQFEGLAAESSYRLQKVGGAILGMVK